LRTAQQQLDELLPITIVEQAIDAIIATSGGDRIVFFNRAAERMFRCEANAAAGQPLDRFLVRRAVSREAVGRVLVHGIRADGELFTAEASVTSVDVSGQPLQAFVLRERDQRDAAALCPDATSRRLIESLDRQARRISHALHDEAGSLLVCAHIALSEAAREVSPVGQQRLDDVRSQLNRLEEQLRSLAHELRPQILDDLGLVPAVEFLASSAGRRWGVAVTVDAIVDERLPADIETAVYRVTQEALTNATRHAQATTLRVSLQQTPRSLCCAIEDDGVGFDVRAVSNRDGECGFGLPGLNDRVHALGGSLLITSAPGQGTKVTATIPLRG
jgi:signal transduction histidine kinase